MGIPSFESRPASARLLTREEAEELANEHTNSRWRALWALIKLVVGGTLSGVLLLLALTGAYWLDTRPPSLQFVLRETGTLVPPSARDLQHRAWAYAIFGDDVWLDLTYTMDRSDLDALLASQRFGEAPPPYWPDDFFKPSVALLRLDGVIAHVSHPPWADAIHRGAYRRETASPRAKWHQDHRHAISAYAVGDGRLFVTYRATRTSVKNPKWKGRRG